MSKCLCKGAKRKPAQVRGFRLLSFFSMRLRLDPYKKCPCQIGCPNGCPCPEYECSPRTDVLVLSTYTRKHLPLITNAQGRKDYDIDFQYGDGTEVISSCSLTWQGEFYVFGGSSKRRQISKLEGCELKQIGRLESLFVSGACANLANEKIYLCFSVYPDKDEYYTCRVGTSPTGSFEKVQNSANDHDMTRIAAS